MADLIEREYGTKRLVNEYCKNCTKRGKYEIFGAACTPCWVMDCVEEFENAPAVNRWIPCSERLPENGERVLVCFRSGTVHIAVWYGDYDEKGAWKVTSQFPTKLYRIDTIPKWMPLPDAYEPPKEGADDA